MKRLKWFQNPGSNIQFFIAGLLLLIALFTCQVWGYYGQIEMAVEQSRLYIRQTAKHIKVSILELIIRAEKGDANIDKYIDKIHENSTIKIRMVHSSAINFEYKFEKDEQPENKFEIAALKDGNPQNWQTDNFFFHAIPLKAGEYCQKCHHLPPDLSEPVPIGYVLGLVEVKIPATALKQVLSGILLHFAVSTTLILTVVFLFGYAIFLVVRVLKLSEKKERAIIKSIGEGIIVAGSDSIILSTNTELCRIFGWQEEELIGQNIEILMPEKYRIAHREGMKRYISGGYSRIIGSRIELEGLKKDGSVFPLEIRIEETIVEEAQNRFFTAAIADITERKNVEDKIKKAYEELKDTQNASLNIMEDLEIRHKELDASLKEKELLLREIHHRVKNNMQVISSLLKLQSGYAGDEQHKEMLEECQNRIKSMAFIHEKLYQSKNLAKIDFNEYIRSLVNGLFRFYKVNTNKVVLNIDVKNIFLGVDTAIPCGLIINEIISNSLKYAFPDERKGEISIAFQKNKDEYELIIMDNGAGIPEDFDFRSAESLGLQLVTMLTEEQLNGKIELGRDEGTEFRIKFKEIMYKKRI